MAGKVNVGKAIKGNVFEIMSELSVDEKIWPENVTSANRLVDSEYRALNYLKPARSHCCNS